MKIKLTSAHFQSDDGKIYENGSVLDTEITEQEKKFLLEKQVAIQIRETPDESIRPAKKAEKKEDVS